MRLIVSKTLLFTLLFFSFSMQAQEQEWSLEKCIYHAMEANILVNQTLLMVKDAEATLSQSRQNRLPNLSGNTGVSWNFGRTIDPTTNNFVTQSFFSNSYGVNSGFTLYNAGAINKTIKQSETNLKALIQDKEQAKIDVSLQVANAFLQVLFAKENIQIAEKQLDLSQQQLDQINKSINAGITPAAERLNLLAQVKQSQQALIDAENNDEIALLNLKQLLRLPPDEDMVIIVPEDITHDTDPDLITFGEAYESAQLNRPDLIAGDLRVKSAEMGVELAKTSYYPSIGVGGSLNTNYAELEGFTSDDYTTQLDNNLSYGFGAQVSIPIYSNGSTRANVERAKINVENSKLGYEQILETLKLNVQQALANARASKKRLEASEEAYNAQKLAFDNTSKRLEIGAANTFEWESQKTQMENAEITKLMDKYTYLFNIKILEFYLGKPLKL
ncbi:MAG: TolC family protein [Saprospiraceae bacterium]|nr:TolC family protein [Saprospiraceae bacterium]